MATLGLLTIGERGEILSIRNGSGTPAAGTNKLLCHVEDIGLRAGKVVEMLSNGGRGSLIVKVEESRIALGRGMTMRIIVRRIACLIWNDRIRIPDGACMGGVVRYL